MKRPLGTGGKGQNLQEETGVFGELASSVLRILLGRGQGVEVWS